MPITSNDNYFEDFEVGEVYEHPRGKTMTEMDNVSLTNLVLNTAEGHFNEDTMQDREFGERIVYGGINLSLVAGLASETVSENALDILGFDDVRFTTPVFHGDTLYAESEVTDKHETETRPDGGVVTFHVRGYNQDDEQVLEAEQTVLLKKAEYWK
jgi:acyl dehydratase